MRPITFFTLLVSLITLTPLAAGAVEDYGARTAAEQAGLVAPGGQPSVAGETTFPGLVGKIVAAALSLLGIVFFGLVLYAGFIWMSAMGNTEKVTKAKDMLEAAAIGLALVVAAYAIASFVFSRFGTSGAGSGASAPDKVAPVSDCAIPGNAGKVCDATGRMVCNSGQCVSKCEAEFGDQNGQCVDIETSPCVAPRKTTTGKCPDPRTTVLCCHNP